jgi:hypothetical protein
MAYKAYSIDLLVARPSTVTVANDGKGIDTLEIQGSYSSATDIRLIYSFNLTSTIASCLFYTPGVTYRWKVIGLIQNVIGCDSADYVIGNQANNPLYGDHNGYSLGDNDTLKRVAFNQVHLTQRNSQHYQRLACLGLHSI